ncbi:MAG: DUF4339 domain-containing protein [Verrucomicrobia bacterium]|nr:DUF4339 domain-containing protein [Verrucomicrobiota bacterium]
MDRKWFYSKDGKQQEGPLSGDELVQLVTSGTLNPRVLVWAQGMQDWIPAENVPELGLTSTSVPQTVELDPNKRPVPDGMGGWMGFVGVMTIIAGVFQVCNLFIGVPMIIAGIALLGAKTALESIHEVDPPVAQFMAKIKTCVAATGVFYILTLALVVLVLIVYAIMGVAVFSAISSQTM